MKKYNFEKTVNLLHYLAKLAGGKINKMKALKLLWLSDRLHLRLYGRTIVDGEYYAMKNGPVASTARDILESSALIPVEKIEYSSSLIGDTQSPYFYICKGEFEKKYFSESDLSVIASIFDEFKHLSEFELSELSHLYPEWKEHEAVLKSGASRREKMHYSLFFEDSEDKRAIFQQHEEVLAHTKSIYN